MHPGIAPNSANLHLFINTRTAGKAFNSVLHLSGGVQYGNLIHSPPMQEPMSCFLQQRPVANKIPADRNTGYPGSSCC
eukprot:150014-Rhodomonas_salina.1